MLTIERPTDQMLELYANHVEPLRRYAFRLTSNHISLPPQHNALAGRICDTIECAAKSTEEVSKLLFRDFVFADHLLLDTLL